MDGASSDDDEFVLLPNQRAWAYDTSSIKVCEKGRQEGYTWATACESVMVASTRKSDLAAKMGFGLDVYFMTTSLGDARIFIEECGRWVERFSPIISACPDVEEYDWVDDMNDPVAIQTYRIRFRAREGGDASPCGLVHPSPS